MSRRSYELGRALTRSMMARSKYMEVESIASAAGMDPVALSQEYIRVMNAADWMAGDDPLRDAMQPMFGKIDGPRTAGRMRPASRLP